MTLFDLTVSNQWGIDLQSSPVPLGSQDWVRKFKLNGAQLKKVSQTTSDGFKVINLGQNCRVLESAVTVLDADDTALTMKIGYTDGTNADDDAYDADVALNSAAITSVVDNNKLLKNATGADFYLTIIPSVLSTMDDDFEFMYECRVRSYHDVPYEEALTAPV